MKAEMTTLVDEKIYAGQAAEFVKGLENYKEAREEAGKYIARLPFFGVVSSPVGKFNKNEKIKAVEKLLEKLKVRAGNQSPLAERLKTFNKRHEYPALFQGDLGKMFEKALTDAGLTPDPAAKVTSAHLFAHK